MEKNNIIVSINCCTYNHENYIAEALDSFINQKTNFQYEILIHDDASTDNTVNIIKTYVKRYPKLIKPIFQKENQHSKGQRVFAINIERSSGKYIANCEGDDYWTDPYKLQKQFDFMEKNPEYSLCVHNADKIIDKSGKYSGSVVDLSTKNKRYSTDEIIREGGGLFPTNSMFYSARYKEDRPSFYYNAPVGDYPETIYLSLMGKVYYIAESMSVYRIGVSSSWTGILSKSSNENQLNFINSMIDMLLDLNVFSNGVYTKSIKQTVKYWEVRKLILLKEFDNVKSTQYKDIYNNFSNKIKLLIFLKQHFPKLLEKYYRFKDVFSR